MKKNLRFIPAAIPAIVVALLLIFEPFYSLDSLCTDTICSQMNGTGDTIKLICIDEETLEEYGPLSTWVREKSAQLIDVLYKDADNAPAVIALDIMFVGDGDKAIDAKLAKSAGNAKNIVTATNLVYRGTTKYHLDGTPYFDARNIETEERPYAALDEAAFSGFANVQLCKDGFVRTAQFYVGVNGERRYSFAAEIYNVYKKTCGYEGDVDALYKRPTSQFFYSGKPGEFPRYSMKDVLSGEIPASEFADSIVLVGAYAPGLQDSYHSAAKRGSDMYGVEINANIIRALMEDKLATHVPAIVTAVIAAILLFGYTLIARKVKMYAALILGVWVILLQIIAGMILASKGLLISMIYVPIVAVLVMIGVIIEKYVLEGIRKQRVLDTFRKYMAPQVIDNMAKDELYQIKLGGERRHVAVLFVDIRGFTAMSETLQPEEVVQILNQYLTLTTECIFAHGGMLDKFIGDATMAIFNAPNDQEDYVYQAVLAGLDMVEKGKILGERLEKQYGRSVSYGIGIHVGDAIVGNIGSDARLDYTAIGDTVNTASRIEGKAGKGELLITEATYELIKDRIDAEFMEAMVLKGKAEPVSVYQVNGIR